MKLLAAFVVFEIRHELPLGFIDSTNLTHFD